MRWEGWKSAHKLPVFLVKEFFCKSHTVTSARVTLAGSILMNTLNCGETKVSILFCLVLFCFDFEELRGTYEARCVRNGETGVRK